MVNRVLVDTLPLFYDVHWAKAHDDMFNDLEALFTGNLVSRSDCRVVGGKPVNP